MRETDKVSPMRLLYVHRGYYPSLAGAEYMTQCLAEEMRRRGHEVAILCNSESESVERRTLSDGLQVIGTPTLEPAFLHSLCEQPPDIVHAVDAVWPEYLFAALALARRLKSGFAITPASATSVWRDVPSALEACRMADRVFVLTGAERAQLARAGVPANRLAVVGQGPYLTGEADPGAFIRAHEVDGPLVLFLGRKMRSKGYALLLEATAEVWQDHPDAHFAFVGPRWDADCAELFATHTNPKITEVGKVDETAKHSALAACDVLCAPSTVDVFPLVLVEAWACRKPVITSRFPGSEEIVRHGHDGLLVDPTSEAVAQAVRHLLADEPLRRSMGRSGSDKVARRFNWQAVADRTETAYEALLTQPGIGVS